MFGRVANVLHSYWSTLVLFKGATQRLHLDHSNKNLSLLYNCGRDVWLALPDFGNKIQLHPLGTAVFASNQYHHYIIHDPGQEKRLGIGRFMQLSVLNRQPLCTFANMQPFLLMFTNVIARKQ